MLSASSNIRKQLFRLTCVALFLMCSFVIYVLIFHRPESTPPLTEFLIGTSKEAGLFDIVFVPEVVKYKRKHSSLPWGAHHDAMWQGFVSDYRNGASNGLNPPESLRKLIVTVLLVSR